MRWASAISQRVALNDALDECAATLVRDLDGGEPDLTVAFVSPHFNPQIDRIAPAVKRRFAHAVFIGCTGAGVIGAGKEVEGAPGFSLTAATLPGVTLTPFRATQSRMPSPDAPPEEWARVVGAQPADDPHFIVLTDPFSFDGETFVAGLDYAYPRATKVGGMASSGQRAQTNALFLGEDLFRDGAVGVAMSGNVVVDTVVAQGCRPIGRPMRISRVDGNLLRALDDRPAMAVLQDLFYSLSPRDRSLLQGNLFLGIAMDPLADTARAGDFLIRNVLGGDDRTGSVAVAAHLREGQLVQFHVRDAETSREDLRGVLEGYQREQRGGPPAGALLFQCTGRGRHLYGEADHDPRLFLELVGALPLGGFFCNGEIGPVSGTTYLHSYTSSFGLFRPRS